MEAPKGFIKDPVSGLFYSDIYVTDLATGKKVRRVVWFDPQTGTFNQVDYPVEESAPETEKTAYGQGQDFPPKSQQSVENVQGGGNSYANMQRPPRKKRWPWVVAGASVFILIVIMGMSILKFVRTPGNTIFEKKTASIVDWNQMKATVSLVEGVERLQNNRLRIQVEGIDLQSLDETLNMEDTYFYIGDYALQLFYYSVDSAWSLRLCKVSDAKPDDWENLFCSERVVSVEPNGFVLECDIIELEQVDFEAIKTIPVQIVVDSYDNQILEGEIRVDSVQNVAPEGEQTPISGTYVQYDKVEGINGIIRFEADKTFFLEVNGPTEYFSTTGTYTRYAENLSLSCKDAFESGGKKVQLISMQIQENGNEMIMDEPTNIGMMMAHDPLIKAEDGTSIKGQESPPPAGNNSGGNNNAGNNNAGNNGAATGSVFPYAGTFVCRDPQIPDEYRPSITFNSDMSFTMAMNTGEGMAYTSGRVTWDSSDNSVSFQFHREAGEPAESYGYFYDANAFVFMGEGYGILGYGDNYGVMTR